MFNKYVWSCYLNKRWYWCLGAIILMFVAGFINTIVFYFALVMLAFFVVISLADYFLLFTSKQGIVVKRIYNPIFNLGEQNVVELFVQSNYGFKVFLNIIDELPVEYQVRDFDLKMQIDAKGTVGNSYLIKANQRGVFEFGVVVVYAQTVLGLVQRRQNIDQELNEFKVYPSTRLFKKYQLLANSNINSLSGERKIRKIGHSLEFDQIKNYVPGDDIRNINWKATARQGQLMTNNYIDEKSQQVYCLIDKGRAMQLPFDGLSLLDYAINASLLFSKIALLKDDKAGIITFDYQVGDMILAEKSSKQIIKINEALYNLKTDFKDASYEALTTRILHKLNQRCFLMLFTNFESLNGLQRQKNYLKRLAQKHLVCVVFFENTLIKALQENLEQTVEGIYINTIADKYAFEKRQIQKELANMGIISILTTPDNLNVNVVNKYLELKNKQLI